MDVHEAIDIMCRRCINYEVCQGTGCGPKKVLTEWASNAKENTNA